jgi:leader peptidase (prepilin peptidase)/N-methyltransferase
MMAGAFVGWQPVVIAFFVGVFAALFVGVAQLLRKGDHPLAFSPALGVGVMATLLTWPAVGRHFFLLFADAWVLGLLAGGGAVILLAAAFLLRLLRGAGQGPDKEKAEAAAGEPKKV